VAQLATKDMYEGKKTDLQGITTKGFSYHNLGIIDMAEGNGITIDPNNEKYAVIGISIDGTSRNISISQEELLYAYQQETGGQYMALRDGIYGDERSDAIAAVIDKFVNHGSGSIDGLFMHKMDGSMSKIDEQEIYDYYQKVKGATKFKDPEHPTDDEKRIAIETFFDNNAIYKKSPQVQKEVSSAVKDAIANSYDGGSSSYITGLYVKNNFGDYTEVSVDDMFDWYENNGGVFSDPDPANYTPAERKAAVSAFLAGNDIYKLEDPGPRSTTALAEIINREIVKQFGKDFAGVVKATPDGELNFQRPGSTITLFDPQVTFDAVSKGFGLKGGASTAGAVTNRKISDLFPPGISFQDLATFDPNTLSNVITLRINDVEITVKEDDTIGSFMTKLNGSNAGVTLSYTGSTNSFTLTSKLEGTANAINMDMRLPTTQVFFATVFGMDSSTRTEAKNFIGIINGEEYIRQSNSFTHEGMTYTFNQTFNVDTANLYVKAPTDSNGKFDPGTEYNEMVTLPGGQLVPRYDMDDEGYLVEIDWTKGGYRSRIVQRNAEGKIDLINSAEFIKADVTKNTDDIVKTVKTFVDEYNDMVTYINDLIKGKRIRKNGAIEYPPLTEEERKALSPEEVKLYDEKAKLGLMANESDLRKVLNDLRTSLYQKVEGVGLTLADIGITTSVNYSDGGTLVVDENKLKAALDRDFDGVVSLFTKSSSIPATEKDSKKLAQRAAENGIAQRLNDILTAAAGTSTGGDKGYLLKKAGMVNDRTQVDNQMTKQLNDYDKKIDKLLERWYRQENNYYMMFARMETAMSKLQAQQNSLAQIMAASGGGK